MYEGLNWICVKHNNVPVVSFINIQSFQESLEHNKLLCFSNMVLVITVLQTFLCTKTEKIYKLTTNYNCSQASMGFQKDLFCIKYAGF